MKSIVLFFFVVGIVMLAVGYQKKIMQAATTKTVVEYRFIPRSIYDQQMSPENLESTFSDMFEKEDVFIRVD
jgi:hypothetical protein